MSAAATVRVRISPTVRRHYEGHDSYGILIKALDEKQCVEVALPIAEALLLNAEEQRLRRDLPKGTPKSLTALAEQLRQALGRPSLRAEERRAERCADGRRAADLIEAGAELPRPGPYDRKQYAEALAAVQAERKKLSDMPANADAFCRRAAAAFWGVWHMFVYEYLQDQPHASGFNFSKACRDALHDMGEGLFWRIRLAHNHELLLRDNDDDGDGDDACVRAVEFHAATRVKGLQKALVTAAKRDFVVQALIERTELAGEAALAEERQDVVTAVIASAGQVQG